MRQRPRHEYLAKVAPTCADLPPDHPARSPSYGDEIQDRRVRAVTNDFYLRNPHYHPVNQAVWGIEIVHPPYPALKHRPKRSWPPAAFKTNRHYCIKAPSVFPYAELQPDGSLRLGTCFAHSVHGGAPLCKHKDIVIPVVKPRGQAATEPANPPATQVTSGASASAPITAPASARTTSLAQPTTGTRTQRETVITHHGPTQNPPTPQKVPLKPHVASISTATSAAGQSGASCIAEGSGGQIPAPNDGQRASPKVAQAPTSTRPASIPAPSIPAPSSIPASPLIHAPPLTPTPIVTAPSNPAAPSNRMSASTPASTIKAALIPTPPIPVPTPTVLTSIPADSVSAPAVTPAEGSTPALAAAPWPSIPSPSTSETLTSSLAPTPSSPAPSASALARACPANATSTSGQPRPSATAQRLLDQLRPTVGSDPAPINDPVGPSSDEQPTTTSLSDIRSIPKPTVPKSEPSMEGRSSAVETRSSDFFAQINDLNMQVLKTMTALEKEKEALKIELAAAMSDNDGLKTELAASRTTCSSVQADYDVLQAKYTTVASSLAALETDKTKLEADKTKLETDKTKLEAEVRSLKRNYAVANSRATDCLTRLNDAQSCFPVIVGNINNPQFCKRVETVISEGIPITKQLLLRLVAVDGELTALDEKETGISKKINDLVKQRKDLNQERTDLDKKKTNCVLDDFRSPKRPRID